MVGSFIQATGTVEFQDDLKRRRQSEARNSLQGVHTIPDINATKGSRETFAK